MRHFYKKKNSNYTFLNFLSYKTYEIHWLWCLNNCRLLRKLSQYKFGINTKNTFHVINRCEVDKTAIPPLYHKKENLNFVKTLAVLSLSWFHESWPYMYIYVRFIQNLIMRYVRDSKGVHLLLIEFGFVSLTKIIPILIVANSSQMIIYFLTNIVAIYIQSRPPPASPSRGSRLDEWKSLRFLNKFVKVTKADL